MMKSLYPLLLLTLCGCSAYNGEQIAWRAEHVGPLMNYGNDLPAAVEEICDKVACKEINQRVNKTDTTMEPAGSFDIWVTINDNDELILGSEPPADPHFIFSQLNKLPPSEQSIVIVDFLTKKGVVIEVEKSYFLHCPDGARVTQECRRTSKTYEPRESLGSVLRKDEKRGNTQE